MNFTNRIKSCMMHIFPFISRQRNIVVAISLFSMDHYQCPPSCHTVISLCCGAVITMSWWMHAVPPLSTRWEFWPTNPHHQAPKASPIQTWKEKCCYCSIDTYNSSCFLEFWFQVNVRPFTSRRRGSALIELPLGRATTSITPSV